MTKGNKTNSVPTYLMRKGKMVLGINRIAGIALLVSTSLLMTGCISFDNQATPLHKACSAGQVEKVKLLIEKGADVNVGDEASVPPLCYAAAAGHAEIVKILLENGAYVSGRRDKIPLNDAAEKGHIDVAEILLSHNADINKQGIDGYTALYVAVAYQQVKMVEFLLSQGADPNITAIYDRTPIFSAYGRGNEEIAKLLLSHGADPHFDRYTAPAYKDFIEKLNQ